MYKTNKSMDFCRSGKTMMDYGSKKAMKDYGKKDKAMMDDKEIKKELREQGFDTIKKDPKTGQKSVTKALTKAEAKAYRLKKKQEKEDPGSKYDPAADKE